MPSKQVSRHGASVIQQFAELVVQEQLERFCERFGRLPRGGEPLFFTPDEPGPSAMPLREVLALVFGAAVSHPELGLEAGDQARAFSILVMVKMGLDHEGLEEALTETGRFRVH